MLNIPTHTPSSNGVFPKLNQPVKVKKLSEFNRHKTFPNRIAFKKGLTSNLSIGDQLFFDLFGQGPIVDLPYDCMHFAFEDYATSQPDAIAVEHLGESMTYGELNRQANRLAARLAKYGVKTGDNVALFLQRSIPMIVGIMGILKAGAAYVPQHVGVAPEAHLNYVLDTAHINVILTISHLQDQVSIANGRSPHVFVIDDLMQEPFADEQEFVAQFVPETAVTANNTCYIIFTSGTTGKPNGVQVTHGNTANLLLTAPGNLDIRPGMKVGQILSIAFDMAAWEILGALSNGATLVIRGKDFLDVIQQVDVVISTPSVLSKFDADHCRNVKIVAVAGEPCPRPLADKWSSFATFYNSCGPTEVTIVNTAETHTPDKEVLSIGRPTPNNTVYILNEDMKPCAIGEIGEMWAGGDCVSTGYIGNDELTRQRYVPDPFLGNGRMMFRTRDLGRWTEIGELEHFGRTDDQVKVRGFRVELDSISNAMETAQTCKRAVSLKLDSNNLVGFVSPCTVDTEEAKQIVADTLPYYYTPKFVLAMPELPMTSRGKIDKKVLMKIAVAYNISTSSSHAQLFAEGSTC